MEKTKKSIFNKILVCLSLCLVLLGALSPCFSMNKNHPLKAESGGGVPVRGSYSSSDLIKGCYLFASGSYSYDGNGYFTFKEKFSCLPGTILTISYTLADTNYMFSLDASGFVFFDNNSNFLCSFSQCLTVNVPEGASYFIYNFRVHNGTATVTDINSFDVDYSFETIAFNYYYWFPFDAYYYSELSDGNVSFINSFDASLDSIVIHNSSSYGIPCFDSYWYSARFNLELFYFLNGNLYCNYPFVFTDEYTRGYGYIVDDHLYNSNFIDIDQINNKDVYFIYDAVNCFSFKSHISCDSNFDFENIFSLTISLLVENPNDISSNNYINFMYTDKNNKFFNFSIYVGNDYLFTTTTYYFIQQDDMTDNDYYNQGFSVGFTDGYNKGNTEGNKAGYDSGYEAGNTIGYNNGYNDGINDSNQYTFINLIGATIDAPIQYFQSLFDFELLGVNLSSFLMGLFTLCVVVTIVKLCLGR